jgi:Flp pilus assembly protein TadG
MTTVTANPATVRGVGDDRGSSAIELVLLTPLLIALVFGLIQTALVWNARHTVLSAAQHGARLARTATALSPAITPTSSDSSTGGSTAADETVRLSTLAFLRQTGGAGLHNPSVTIQHDGSFVIVTVTATTLGVLPGATQLQVSASSRTPSEGFRP